jgi:F-type H+-transporting ATPase subunit a
MHDPNTSPLIAQEEHGTAPKQETGAPAGEPGKEGTAEAGHKAGAEGGTGAIFTELLGELGDHHEISVGGKTVLHLPVILVDGGLHVYPSVEAMEESGEYIMNAHHHIVRAPKPGEEQAPTTGTGEPAKHVEHAPSLDLSVTSLVAFQWLAMFILAAIMIPMSRRYKKNGIRPMRGFFNAMESVVVYVRDEIVLPNTGDAGKKLLPIFMTFFFFILAMNLIGLVPGGHSATGSLNVTAGLAIIAFFTIQLAAIFKNGLVSWLKHLTGGVPLWLWPIMVPVEVLGLFTKPFALCVRLFANMTAGHVILISLIGLVFVTSAFIPVTLGFSLFINILELLVAFIQAYIFTMLTAVFAGIGMASHDDHGHEHGAEHAAAH